MAGRGDGGCLIDNMENWEPSLSQPPSGYNNGIGFVLLQMDHDFVEEWERQKKVSKGFGPMANKRVSLGVSADYRSGAV